MASDKPVRRAVAGAIALSSVLLAAGCSGGDPSCPDPAHCAPNSTTQVMMDLSLPDGFYSAPFPSDARLSADGIADLSTFPNPDKIDLVSRVLAILAKDGRGFGTTSGVFFRLTGPIADGQLPDPHQSLRADARVFLVGVDKAAPDYLKRYPIEAAFLADGGPFGAKNLLALIPYQGIPLRPKTRYAAVVATGIVDANGAAIAASPALAKILAAERPAGMTYAVFAEYRAAIDALAEAHVDPHAIAGLTVFTTGDPTQAIGAVRDAMIAKPPAPSKPFVKNEVFDDYCVYESTIPMPEYQEGTPPYTDAGGDWVFDAGGKPVLQRQEEANFVVTVPRRAMPANGFPIVVLSRTGAGGERPLVDRGVQAMHDGPALVPGTGPALYFAKAGFAGASVDGPHGGLRNVTHGDEQFLMFNVSNPAAMRDNVRQSAAELALVSRVLEDLAFDASDCPGLTTPQNGPVRFDKGTMALMGHSMGATISPLTLAVETRFRAGILSGAGGSWIENILHKQSPVAIKGIAEVLLHVAGTDYALTQFDPMLSLFQWAAEAADPPAYGRRIVHEPASGSPRHVLMLQGIVDTYILPPIANATSLSLGLDLAGEEIDMGDPQIAAFTPLGQLLDLSGRGAISLPASGNVSTASGPVTAVVVQHPSDGIEDGHEVVFQTAAPKHQYLCFLQGLAAGKVSAPPGAGDLDPCP